MDQPSQDIFEDFKCAICFQKFDNSQHEPYMLKCGHNLCMKSIEKIVKINRFTQTTHIKCPLCKQEGHYQGHDKPFGIGKNYALLNIMEKFTKFHCIPIKEPLSLPLIKKIDQLNPIFKFIKQWPEQVKQQLIREERQEFYQSQQDWTTLEQKRKDFLKKKDDQLKEIEKVEKLLNKLTVQIKKSGFVGENHSQQNLFATNTLLNNEISLQLRQNQSLQNQVQHFQQDTIPLQLNPEEESQIEPSPPPNPNIQSYRNSFQRINVNDESDEENNENGGQQPPSGNIFQQSHQQQENEDFVFFSQSQFDVVPETNIITANLQSRIILPQQNSQPNQQQQQQGNIINNNNENTNNIGGGGGHSQTQNMFQN